MQTSLSSEILRDKILGCWLGKNCGGTLGAPLERGYGLPEPFNISWYPKIEEGGIPNDDLELQLIWLVALEEVGPALDARALTRYWLDHVAYNFDEYGFHKTNLRMGLTPPVSGIHNNWFIDCMGSPIRSEIWACVAPGFPRLAARYAYEDAIVDHAGGEGVYGELFNAAIQASAFVVEDPLTLIQIGLTYVPPECRTYAAVTAALAAHAEGLDWQQARRRVLETVPHYNSQYAPVNMGFQIIGWLYGADFGDALCKAVNCGYDTDCTGATLGACLGIVQGSRRLPSKWTEPLGTVIATNASWGGLINLEKAAYPIPTDILELTERTIAQIERVLSYHGLSLHAISSDIDSLKADAGIRELWRKNPWQLSYNLDDVSVAVEYPESATISHGQKRTFLTHLTSHCSAKMDLQVELRPPAGFEVSEQRRELTLGCRSTESLVWEIQATGALLPSNRFDLAVFVKQRPALPTVPIVWLGAVRWRLLEDLTCPELSAREIFEHVFEPEASVSDPLTAGARTGAWKIANAETNAVPFAAPLKGKGVSYAQTFCQSPAAQRVRIGVPTNVAVKIWLNNELVNETWEFRPFRPNYGGTDDERPIPYVEVELREGWNEILLKFVRVDEPLRPANAGMEAALLLTEPANRRLAGLVDQVRSYLPWE